MTITTREIPRLAWRSYFEELTNVLGTVEATVEVVGRDLGDQFANERQILTDITRPRCLLDRRPARRPRRRTPAPG